MKDTHIVKYVLKGALCLDWVHVHKTVNIEKEQRLSIVNTI